MLENRSVLDLDSFDGITTLEQLRDYIPTLGASLKTFAASKNQRYLDPFSMRLLNDRTTFTSPMNLYTPFKVESAGVYLRPLLPQLSNVVSRVFYLTQPWIISVYRVQNSPCPPGSRCCRQLILPRSTVLPSCASLCKRIPPSRAGGGSMLESSAMGPTVSCWNETTCIYRDTYIDTYMCVYV